MRRTTTRLMAALALLPLAAHAHATDEATQVSFVAPPWPGVTVKTEIMAQILAPLATVVGALSQSQISMFGSAALLAISFRLIWI